MQTIEYHQAAIAKAEENLATCQAEKDKHAAAETELIQRHETLIARKAEIAGLIAQHDADLVDAVAGGGKHPKNETAALRAEATAIDEVIASFPTRLANSRSNAYLKDNGVHAAKGALHQAQFDHAVFVYRAAMAGIWPLVDAVHQLAASRADLTGMADSSSRFGRLPD